jgi:hypothetical protein
MGYCADQENGGIIQNCEDWGDRRWMQTCAVTRAEIDASKPLAFWDASALHVAFYPCNQEAKFQANRLNGKKGGRPKCLTEDKPHGEPKENHMVRFGVNVMEEEEKRKRKEKEEKKELSLVGSVEPTKTKTFKDLTKEEFVSQCQTLSEGILDEEEAIGFCRYWIEPNTKGKMKFQLQKTWDINLRMHTWKANADKFAERKQNGNNG